VQKSFITTNKHLEVKSAQRALFVCCLFDLCLIVDARSGTALGPAAFSKILDLCHPHPQNSALRSRRIPARKLCENLMHTYPSAAQGLARANLMQISSSHIDRGPSQIV
jgi:hypothetical protein